MNVWKVLKQAFNDFGDNKTTRLSAALAYYTVFSLAPMLIVIITLCDVFYGRAAVEGNIYEQIKGLVGPEAALQIQQLIKNAAISHDITWASIIGIISLVFAATGVFAEIQDSLNFIWHLKAKPKKGWVKMILNRLLSFSMVVSLGFILLVSLVVSAFIDALGARLTSFLPEVSVYVAYALNLLITFVVITSLFAIIFKVLPDARIQWKDVWVGSITTAGLFMIGKFLISYYLGNSKIGNTYGTAGSIIVILLWVYYSAIILYFGAAFTKAYTQHKGRRIYPNSYAVWIEQVEMENKASLQEQQEQLVKKENPTN